MFMNMGPKIKTYGKVIFWIASAFCWAYAVYLIASGIGSGNETLMVAALLSGLAVAVVGPLSAYLAVMFIIGFGELIESTTETKRNTRAILDHLRNKTHANNQANAYQQPYAVNPYQAYQPVIAVQAQPVAVQPVTPAPAAPAAPVAPVVAEPVVAEPAPVAGPAPVAEPEIVAEPAPAAEPFDAEATMVLDTPVAE